MLIRTALSLVLAAFALLVLVKILIGLAIPVIPELITRLALATLFSAFAILAITGLWAAFKRILLNLRRFFSAPQRRTRRLLFLESRQNQIQQLLQFKTAQIKYFHDLKRKKLLAADNCRQTKALSAAVKQELSAARQQLPKDVFKKLQRDYRYSRQDSAALLQLQQTIASLKQL